MLKFIERYQLDRNQVKRLPNSISKINDLLKSDWHSTPISIMKGDKRGEFITFNHDQVDEFGFPTSYFARSFSSACSTAYSLIIKKYPDLAKVNFQAKNKTLANFPKKHHKAIEDLLNYLYEVDPLFDINGKLLTPQQYREMKGDKHYEQNTPENLAVIVHGERAMSVYDYISRQFQIIRPQVLDKPEGGDCPPL